MYRVLWGFSVFILLNASPVFATDLDKCNQILSWLEAQHPGALLENEKFIDGSRIKEIKSFTEDFWRVLRAQKELALVNEGEVGRAFHRKILGGGSMAYVEILNGKGGEGFFAQPVGAIFPAVVRFSGGVGETKADWKPDVTGMAIKIFDRFPTENDKAPIHTMDWTSTKGVSAFATDQRRFVEFLEAMAPGPKKLQRLFSYVRSQPKAFLRIISSSLRPYSSVFLQEYGLNHPYALDSSRAFRMRFKINDTESRLPTSIDPAIIKRDIGGILNYPDTLFNALTDPNYLGNDLLKWLSAGNIEFIGSIQLEDAKLSSEKQIQQVEDGLAVWKTKETPVIRIVLLANSTSFETTSLVEQMGWNPGNVLFNHRPAGRLGRGRVWAYAASQIGRDSLKGEELQAVYRKLIGYIRERVKK